jgi:inhibitor of cysteine peptidase
VKVSLTNIVKIIVVALTVVLISDFFCFSSSAAVNKEVEIVIDGKIVTLDNAPFIKNDRTLVPLRGIFEKLGATVDWNKYTKQAIIKTKASEIILEVGNKYVLLDGEVVTLDAVTEMNSDRVFVPFRFIAEALGHDVKWDGDDYQVQITTKHVAKPKSTLLPKVGSKEKLDQLLHYSQLLNTYINDGMGLMTKELIFAPNEVQEAGATNAPSEAAKSEEQSDSSTSNKDDFSQTNNQTEGVDEGDIIKTNGTHLFTLNQNRVHIVSTNPLAPKLIKTIEISDSRGFVTDMYITKNQIILIGTSYGAVAYPADAMLESRMKIMPYYTSTSTFVVVYSIEDILNPVIVQDYDFEGSYSSSRLVDNTLYMVTNKGFYDWRIQPVVPKYTNNKTKQVMSIDYDSIYYFPDYITPNFVLTIGIDLATKEVDVKSYLGNAEGMYVSDKHIFITMTKYVYGNKQEIGLFAPRYDQTTSIYKFAYNQGKIDYKAEGNVEGHIVNQFSLDEYQGNLRIATTSGNMWDDSNPSKNNIYILNEELQQIGQLTGLAEGERIYSTRFSGDRIYMVTFKQVDPFFVIDASIATDPKVLGYLKIPGFSTYMHILDNNHVLGFGTETVEKDGRVTTGGLKISLFDVTDPTKPIESMKEVIGVEGTNSEIANNHKALMISLSKGIMAFPINVSKEPYKTDFSGAYVYTVTKDSFSYRGKITHHSETTLLGEPPYQYYDFNYSINRVVYVGEYLYSISGGKVVATSLLDMKTTGSVELPLKVYNTEIYQ